VTFELGNVSMKAFPRQLQTFDILVAMIARNPRDAWVSIYKDDMCEDFSREHQVAFLLF